MADIKLKHLKNKPGTFFVDTTCIDCDACRMIAPNFFSRDGGQSVISNQPSRKEDILKAIEAEITCPTASIGSTVSWKNDKAINVTEIAGSYPQQITDNIYYCGYHSEKSFGAASYFILHPGGNILVDTPRFAGPLVKSIHNMGGIKYHFLSHIDDVADHKKYHDEFNTRRIIHKHEATQNLGTIEVILDIKEPFKLLDDVTLIPTPGHTKGHMVLHFKRCLFTGDHLAWSPRLGHLYAFRNFCWYSWSEQIKSMESLLDYRFQTVLPGHGRRHFTPGNQMREQLQKCIKWMKSVA